MINEKKQNEIKVLAKYLRNEIVNVEDLKFVVNELFKGQAEVSNDKQGQLVVYTGHSNGLCSGDVSSMETKEFLNS